MLNPKSNVEYDPREEKLPVWAKTLLVNMRQRVENAESRAEEARLATDPAGSDTLIHFYDDVPIGLGRGERVRFLPGGPGDQLAWVNVRVRRSGDIEVMASHMLTVRPEATNVVAVQAVKNR